MIPFLSIAVKRNKHQSCNDCNDNIPLHDEPRPKTIQKLLEEGEGLQ